MNSVFLFFGALYGASGVALGAFGAHALKETLGPDRIGVWETAVTYQLFHALGLLFVYFLQRGSDDSMLVSVAGWLFVAGVLAFSGSLYALGLGAPRWFGPITPLGGLLLISGWVCLIVTAWRQIG